LTQIRKWQKEMQTPTPAHSVFSNWYPANWLLLDILFLAVIAIIAGSLAYHYISNYLLLRKKRKIYNKLAPEINQQIRNFLFLHSGVLSDEDIDNFIKNDLSAKLLQLDNDEIVRFVRALITTQRIPHRLSYLLLTLNGAIDSIKQEEAGLPNFIRNTRLQALYRRHKIDPEKITVVRAFSTSKLFYLQPPAYYSFFRTLRRFYILQDTITFRITKFVRFITFFIIGIPFGLLALFGPLILMPAGLQMMRPECFDGTQRWGTAWLFSLVLFAVLIFALSSIFVKYRKTFDRWGEFLGVGGADGLLLTFVIAAGVACLLLFYPSYRWLEAAVFSKQYFFALTLMNFLLLVFLIFFLFVIAACIDTAAIALLIRRAALIKPQAYIAIQLYNLVYTLEASSLRWNEVASKNALATGLENLAVLVENALGRKMRGADLETNLWLKSNLSGIALAFRLKKKLVFSSLPDSREKLLNSLSQSLYNVVEGNWGKLEVEEIASLTLREGSQLWLKRVWAGIKAVIIAAIPLGLIYLSQLDLVPQLSVPPDYLPYVKIGGVIWFAVSLIIAIDPLYSSKLDFVSKAQGVVTNILGSRGKN
jgi:hypothetical protein